MPNGKVPSAEYNAFLKWFRGIYGATAEIPPNDEALAGLPLYQMWVVQGRQGYPTWTSAEAYAKEVAQYKEKPWGAPALAAEDWQTLYERYPYDPKEEEGIGYEPTEEEIARAWRISAGLEPAVGAEGLTKWQQAQIARWGREAGVERERFEWQMSQAAEERALAARGTARERELADRLRLQQELAQLGGPADWIRRWEMVHEVIPAHRARELQLQARTLLQEAQDLTGAERTLKEMKSIQLEEKARDIMTKVRLQEAPPSPEWLPQFLLPTTDGQRAEVPTAGEPIEKRRVQTPSGQQWISTPLSEREGLRGYTQWAGYRPLSDILDEMAMMAPRTPTGAGRTKWAPATQRA